MTQGGRIKTGTEENQLLDTITSPEDLRELPMSALPALAAEIRARITEVVSRNGGHLSSNLGVVELTLALHRVFDFRRDRLVFDVGHQCYTHKILTGRRAAFHTIRTAGGLSGFPNPSESEYDTFISGHASTSISAATGLATAIRLSGEKRKVVALIGDGSISGGMCFEAMNHAGHEQEDLIVILNDNEMAIGRTVGAFARRLEEFRSTPEGTQMHRELRQILQCIPLIGVSLDWLQQRVLDSMKNHTGAAAIFEALGFRYFGPFDGHNIPLMEDALQNLRQLSGPLLLHVITEKGRGFAAAAADPESFHSAAPFTIVGTGEVVTRTQNINSYSNIAAQELLRLAREDQKIVAITAAMTAGTGLNTLASELPGRFFDVGIAEEHAIPFAAALAREGYKPAVAIYSTFLQRGYDQVFHDLVLQGCLPVTLLLDRAGLVGQDGPTHHGIYDIAFLRHLPNLVLLAPRDGEELQQMLRFALAQGRPCAIRYPRGGPDLLPTLHAPLELGRSERLTDGEDGTVFAYGRMVFPALQAAKLAAESGIRIGVVNARFAKPLDEAALLEAAAGGLVFTAEDHALAGGFGSAVCELLADHGVACRIVRLGIPDEFIRGASPAEQYHTLQLDAQGLAATFIREAQHRRAIPPRRSPAGVIPT